MRQVRDQCLAAARAGGAPLAGGRYMRLLPELPPLAIEPELLRAIGRAGGLSDGTHNKWTAQLLTGVGSGFSNVTGVAVVHQAVWLVGSALDQPSGNQLTLVARNTGSGWTQVAAPNPGTGDRILGGISPAGSTAWAVGAFDGNTGRDPLIMVNSR